MEIDASAATPESDSDTWRREASKFEETTWHIIFPFHQDPIAQYSRPSFTHPAYEDADRLALELSEEPGAERGILLCRAEVLSPSSRTKMGKLSRSRCTQRAASSAKLNASAKARVSPLLGTHSWRSLAARNGCGGLAENRD